MLPSDLLHSQDFTSARFIFFLLPSITAIFFNISIVWLSVSTPYILILLIILPSAILAFGIMQLSIPASLAAHTIGSTPLTGLMLPSRLTSPIINTFSNIFKSKQPFAASIPIAIGRSYIVPSFLILAGDILITIFCGVSSIPEFLIATLTLSFASLTLDPSAPLISNVGSPKPTSVSTLTIYASIPYTAALITLLNTSHPFPFSNLSLQL